MKTTNKAPFTHGMEIEQTSGLMPAGTTNNSGVLANWHRDLSGPQETTIGPYKNAKSILNRFYAGTRDERGTWDWAAADGSTGCGSHVHVCLADDVFEDADDSVAWSIAYNTAVELAPFFAPFFCHNWQDGFRNGTQYNGNQTNIRRWASPQLTRLSPNTLARSLRSPGGRFQSVVFSPRAGDKPVTIELRMNDAHPGVGLTGALYVRRVAGRAIEGGYSPKLAERSMLEQAYNTVYDDAMDMGLMEAMAQPARYEFLENRGIPGIDSLEFDSMLEVLKAILNAYPQTPHSWSYRVQRLVAQGDDAYSPAQNNDALWNLDAPIDQFEWDNGPDVR